MLYNIILLKFFISFYVLYDNMTVNMSCVMLNLNPSYKKVKRNKNEKINKVY